MGMFKTSCKVEKLYGCFGRNIPWRKYKPFTRIDFYDEKTGELLQQRWYNEKGIEVWDRDWKHGDSNNTHIFPHDHPWDHTKKKSRQFAVDYINKNYY